MNIFIISMYVAKKGNTWMDKAVMGMRAERAIDNVKHRDEPIKVIIFQNISNAFNL
jgi:hypothetical protein